MPLLKDESEVEEFIRLETQLQSSRRELAELSKKKPNDGVNKFKLGHLNTMLRKANQILSDSLPLEDFTEFDVDLLPSNSDVVFVLAQYTDAIYRFRTSNTHVSGGVTLWTLKNSRAEVRAGSLWDYRYKD